MKKRLFISVATLSLLGCLIALGASDVLVAAQTTLTNPITAGGSDDIRAVIGAIIKGVLGLTGTLALAVFVYGGFQWLLARGESGEVKKGLDTMLWAGIGLAVIFGSYAILDRVFKILPQ